MADLPSTATRRLARLEADNARLRRLLDVAGIDQTLRHGLRDTLAMMRSIMRQSAETATDVESYVAHLEGRFDALMRVRASIEAFGDVGLRQMVSDALLTHLAHEGEQVALDGPAIRLQPRPAQAFALAMHELATNAVEHGALRTPEGRVEASWEVDASADAPALVFVWAEWSRPPPAAAPTPVQRGFGTMVIEETLAYALKARSRLIYGAEGLRCVIRFPLAPDVGHCVAVGGDEADHV